MAERCEETSEGKCDVRLEGLMLELMSQWYCCQNAIDVAAWLIFFLLILKRSYCLIAVGYFKLMAEC